jgi:hypothetical protein
MDVGQFAPGEPWLVSAHLIVYSPSRRLTFTSARQVEAVELMVASNTITVAHANALLKATHPEQRTDFKPTEHDKKLAPIEQIVKLEEDMS